MAKKKSNKGKSKKYTSKQGKKYTSKKGVVSNVRGRIPYSRSRKATVLGGRIANTGQRIKSGLDGGPGGWSTSTRAGTYNIGSGLIGPTEIQRLGLLAHKKRKRARKLRYKKKEIAMIFDEILPTVTCTTNCVRNNLGHRLGLNKSRKYKRRR
jgi:hypothetical protein